MVYAPSQKILDKYADVLVNFALNRGKGIKKGDVVILQVPECAKPLLISLRKALLKAGANFITQYSPEGIAKDFYELANDKQLNFFPDKYYKGLVEQADSFLSIDSTIDKYELAKVPPKKIMTRSKSMKPYLNWRDEKENKGKLSWVLALYGTEAMAKDVGMSAKEYWNQIIKACYLDEKNPVKKWKEADNEIYRIIGILNKLKIKKLHIKSKNVDLVVGIGKNRKWLGGRGLNIPSFEIFISPDCRMTNGKIKFNQPLYRYGNLINGISLEFKNGRVIRASAKKGEKVLKEMIAVKGADMIGEFSLTDNRLSRINKFMGETLFDENFGGKYGNTHIALGNAYQDSYPGNLSKVKKSQWKKMGYNKSVIHTDMISTENRIVTAFLEDGTQKVIYRDGKFVV